MAYNLYKYKYLYGLFYILMAFFLSTFVKQDVLLLLNLAVMGGLATLVLLKYEMVLLCSAIIASIFYEGITQVNATYLIFYLYILMLFTILINKEKNKVSVIILFAVLFSFLISSIPSLINGTSLPVLIITALKRYGFVIVFLFALNMNSINEKYKKSFDLLIIAALLVNFIFAGVQYLSGELTQDSITGLIGTGNTGIFIYLFMFFLAIISGLHYQQRISTLLFAGLSVIPIIYSAIAEVKIGFVSSAAMLFVYLVFMNRSLKAFFLLIVTGFALIWLYNFFISLYPAHDFLNKAFLENYLVDQSYGAGSTLNRFGFKETIDNVVFANSSSDILFGKGLGSGNPSDVNFLKGEIFLQFDYLKYSWFVIPYLYIETGLIGTFSYLLIYIIPLVIALIEFFRRGTSLAMVVLLMGFTNLLYLPYNMGLFNYGVTTIYWIYFAMLLKEMQSMKLRLKNN